MSRTSKKDKFPRDFLIRVPNELLHEHLKYTEIMTPGKDFAIKGSNDFCFQGNRKERQLVAERMHTDLGLNSLDNEVLQLFEEIFNDYDASTAQVTSREVMSYLFANPLVNLNSIKQMQDAVGELKKNAQLRERLWAVIKDLEEAFFKPLIYFSDIGAIPNIDFENWKSETVCCYEEEVPMISARLSGVKSKLLQDILSALQSAKDPNSPMYPYLRLLRAKNIDAVIRGNSLSASPRTSRAQFQGYFQTVDVCLINLLYNTRDGIATSNLFMGCLSLLTYLGFVAQLSIKYGLTTPEFNDEGALELRNARYLPFVLDKRKKCVGHNIRLSPNEHAYVVTGTVGAGKTITIKTIFSIALMAQAGMDVPAAYARLPIYSSFLTHCINEMGRGNKSEGQMEQKNLRTIMKLRDPNALYLLDGIWRLTEPGVADEYRKAVPRLASGKYGTVLIATHQHNVMRELSGNPEISPNIRFTEISRNHVLEEGKISSGGYSSGAARRAGII